MSAKQLAGPCPVSGYLAAAAGGGAASAKRRRRCGLELESISFALCLESCL